MWEISNNRQLVAFLISLLFGAGYAVVYTFLKALRKTIKHSAAALFFEDIIFFEIISFITFMLMLALESGEIRFYILIAIFLGFTAFYLILSHPLSDFLAMIFKFFIRVFVFIKRYISSAFGVFCKTAGKIAAFCGEKLRICGKYLKNILKATHNMVYTKTGNTEDDKGVN